MGLMSLLRAAFVVPAPFAPRGGPLSGDVGSPWAGPDVLSHVALEDVFGDGVPADWPLTRHEAECIPAVAAVRHRVAGTLSRLPVLALNPDGTPYTANPVATQIIRQPDPGEPRSATYNKTIEDMIFDGGAYWAVTNTYRTGQADGAPARPWSAIHIPIAQIEQSKDGIANVAGSYLAWLERARGIKVLAHPSGRQDLCWLIFFDGPGPGLLRRPRALRSAADLDRSFSLAAANPVPSIELHQTTDDVLADDEIAEMIESWRKARRRGGVGFTNSAVELKTHGLDLSQLLVDGRNQQAVEIARLAGIPAASIDAGIPGSSLTYANLVDRLTDLVNFGLQMYASPITDRLTMDDVLPRGIVAKHDYSELYPAPAAPVNEPAARPAVPAPNL